MRFELERSPTEKLIIEKSNFKGRDLVNMRIYYLADGEGEEEWRPTKKGITFRLDQLDEVLGFLNKFKGA